MLNHRVVLTSIITAAMAMMEGGIIRIFIGPGAVH